MTGIDRDPPTLPLSVNLMPHASAGAVAELAALAEDHGLARCWVYDEGLVTRDVWVTLAAIATRTERLPIGPGITNPFVRHPGATAAAVATLDELSGGRAFLGLGAGGGMTLTPLGIERRRPVSTVAEMVTSLRALFAGERVTHEGETFRFVDATIGYARPDIEIILAGRGPRMTALGAELADGFNLSWIHKDLLADHVASLRDAAGDRPFRISWSTMLATTDAHLDEARAQLSFRLPDSPAAVKDLLGVTDGHIAELRRLLAAGGPAAAAAAVDPAWVTSFVVHGTSTECAAEIRDRMQRDGIDEFQLPTLELDHAAELIEATAPLFR